MKLLHEADIRFQLHQDEHGGLILSAVVISDDLKPGVSKASAASLAAGSAYALFLDGSVHRKAKELFNVDLGIKRDGP